MLLLVINSTIIISQQEFTMFVRKGSNSILYIVSMINKLKTTFLISAV